MVTTTGVQAQGEGRHYDTMTRMTAMVSTTQDRLQDRFPTMRPTTSLDYVIRQTDRLQELRLKLFRLFSHGSRTRTTTREDMTTTEVDTAARNGNDYNNCDVSTTATMPLHQLRSRCRPPPVQPAQQALCYRKPVYHNLQETRNFLSINNYEFVRQMDHSLQSVSLQDVANSTRVGRIRRDAVDGNEQAQDALNREYDIPLLERAAGRTDAAIEAELEVLRNAHVPLQRDYDEWLDKVERGGDYLNYILIHGTKRGTEANNYVRRLQRSTNGFEALRLLRLRYSGGQMLQNYQLLRELLNPKFTEAQQHFQYRQWLESLSRYELEARQPLDYNLKIATLVNGLRRHYEAIYNNICYYRSSRPLHGSM